MTTGSVAKSSAPNSACRTDRPMRRAIPPIAIVAATSAESWTKPTNRSVRPRIIVNESAISAFGGKPFSRASFAPGT